MRLFCLSDNPNRPCYVLKYMNVSILFDCGLDLSSTLSFLPIPMVLNTRLSNLPLWTPRDSGDALGEFREANNRVFIDSTPEFGIVETHLVDFSDIDAILISNYQCMLGLPYITEQSGFRGSIYMTEATQQMGRLLFEELLEYVERTPKARNSTVWKETSFEKYLPLLLTNSTKVRSWRPLYKMEEVNSCLSKVKLVGFSEKVSIFGAVEISCVSSGYCLGSCNWIIQGDHVKVGYMCASSTLTTHPKPIEHVPFRNLDVIVMTSLTQTPLVTPDDMLGDFCNAAVQTLKNGGNVLVPCYPSGNIYDLLECLSSQLELASLLHVPIYFLSPVADKSLAFSSILAEWLAASKQAKVYIPEEPFPHSQLVRAGRLKHFTSIQDEGFMSEFHIPCVVFAGHPSLRFGDAVHFMELWANDPNSAVIFTEPDFSDADVIAPFQPVAMKVLYYPIDTSLNFVQANKLIGDLKPRHLITHKQYTVPPLLHPEKSDLVLKSESNMLKCSRGEVLRIPLKRKYQKIILSDELSNSLTPVEVESKRGVALCTLTGQLDVLNNQYSLTPASLIEKGSDGKKVSVLESGLVHPDRYTYGELNANKLVQTLTEAGFNDVKSEKAATGVIVHIPHEDTLIHIEERQTHVICDGESQSRSIIRNCILACLNKF